MATIHLQFDYVPDSINVGEPFSCAVVLADREGEPLTPEDAEALAAGATIVVRLGAVASRAPDNRDDDAGCIDDGADHTDRTCLGGGDASDGGSDPTTVELSCGEAYFDGVFVTRAGARDVAAGALRLRATATVMSTVGASHLGVRFRAAVSASVPLRGGAKTTTGTPSEAAAVDEALDSVPELVLRLRDSSGARTRHYLMLLRGRLWGREGNAPRIVESRAAFAVNDVLARPTVDSDEAIECVGFVQALLTNATGAALASCGACRSIIQAVAGDARVVVRAPNGVYFHSSCLLCVGCGSELGDTGFVRDIADRPFHSDCATRGAVAVPSDVAVALRCQVVTLDAIAVATGTDSEHGNVAASDFLTGGEAARFVAVLRGNAQLWGDEYVRIRVQRMLSAVAAQGPSHAEVLALLRAGLGDV